MIPEHARAKARHLREIADQLCAASRDLGSRCQDARVLCANRREARQQLVAGFQTTRTRGGAVEEEKALRAVENEIRHADGERSRLAAELEALQSRTQAAGELADRVDQFLRARAGEPVREVA